MILEWLEALTTPCPRTWRRMGYLREAIAIRYRQRRCRDAWALHLEHSRRFVRESAAESGGGRKALILGAGLVYDLPIDDLAHAFDQVLLVDLVHLRPARLAARRFANVRLVSRDLTESLENIHAGKPVAETPNGFLDDPAIDFVVSLNLASQLPVIPLAWLERRGVADEDARAALGRRLIEAHLEYLGRFNCPVCLITDVERIHHDAAGKEVRREAPLHGVPLPVGGESWIWDIAPLGEIDGDTVVSHRVTAVQLNRS